MLTVACEYYDMYTGKRRIICIHNLLKYTSVFHESFEIPKEKYTFVVITNMHSIEARL